MMGQPLEVVKHFLSSHFEGGKPVILALSGGTDSLALFYLLLECRAFFPLDLHVAHVNHRWRKESDEEAEILSQKVRYFGIPFHLHTLDGMPDSNVEAHSRKMRLLFFAKLYHQLGSQALILAHHRGDQVETMIKKLFEGSSLFHLGGMQSERILEGMMVWRPLLSLPKKALAAWLDKRHLTPFDDYTNRDRRFLRAKLRLDLLPDMEKKFGKNVAQNLSLLSDTFLNLSAYFAKKCEPFFDHLVEGPWGFYLDLSPFYPLEPLEWHYFIHALCERLSITMSRAALDTLIALLLIQANHKKVVVEGVTFLVAKNYFFILTAFPDLRFTPMPLKTCHLSELHIFLKDSGEKQERMPCWKELWTGQVSLSIKKGRYLLIPPNPKLDYGGSTVGEVYRTQRVPVFLRALFPLIYCIDCDEVKYDFLSGKRDGFSDSDQNTTVILHVDQKNRKNHRTNFLEFAKLGKY